MTLDQAIALLDEFDTQVLAAGIFEKGNKSKAAKLLSITAECKYDRYQFGVLFDTVCEKIKKSIEEN